MRFGLFTSLTHTTWEEVLALWRHAEATGWDAACVTDHSITPYWHPAVLAKIAAQVDIVSGGRLICGIDAGWQENEHRAYGLLFHTLGERLGRLDEACQILKSLWTRPRTSFEGRYYRLDDAPHMPKPVQGPHPELIMLLRITEDRADVERLRSEFRRRLGRDEAAAADTLLAGSLAEVQDKLGRLQDAGIDMLFVPTILTPKDPRPQLDRFMSEAAPAFR